MPQTAEYKLISGPATQVGIQVAREAASNWKPILMTAVPTGESTPVALFVILEHLTGA